MRLIQTSKEKPHSRAQGQGLGLKAISGGGGILETVHSLLGGRGDPVKGREPVLRDTACAHTLWAHRISTWHRDCSPTSAGIVQNQVYEPFPH